MSARVIRNIGVAVAALGAVALVIAIPHLAGRAEHATPTAPPIAGAPLPSGEQAVAGTSEPDVAPLQRLVPPAHGVLLGVSNPRCRATRARSRTGPPTTARARGS